MSTIYTTVMIFMSVMGNAGFHCDIEEVQENTAIVSCQNKHVGITEWLDIRSPEPILISHYRVT